MKPADFYFAIALLDHSWIIGSVIGSVAGALLKFDTTGVDFAMTALFVVIAVASGKKQAASPALGGVCIVSLSHRAGQFRCALGAIVVLLLSLRGTLDEEKGMLPAQRKHASGGEEMALTPAQAAPSALR